MGEKDKNRRENRKDRWLNSRIRRTKENAVRSLRPDYQLENDQVAISDSVWPF